MKYPNIKGGFRWCCIVGGVFAVLWIAFCCWLATSPPETGTCLRIGPWSMVAESALAIFLFTGVPCGLAVAFRPDFRDRK
jgi:hypothetical protein